MGVPNRVATMVRELVIASLFYIVALVLAIIGAYGAMAVALGLGVVFMVRRAIGRHMVRGRRRRWRRRHNMALRHRQSSKAITLFCNAGGTPVSGLVRSGHWAGRRLESLSLDVLLDIGAAIDARDEASLILLGRYLDAAHPGWRTSDSEPGAQCGARGAEGPSSSAHRTGPPDRAEALRILGLADGASPEEIRSTHRRLILRIHPDVGGSAAMTAEVNAAKTTLLQGWKQKAGAPGKPTTR